MESLGGQLDFMRGALILRRQGVKISLGVSRVGHHIMIAVDFCDGPSWSAPRCPEASGSFPHSVQKAPDLSDGGPHSPYTPDGPYPLETPLAFAARKAARRARRRVSRNCM